MSNDSHLIANEKHRRRMLEQSLRERIGQLEAQLSAANAEVGRLREAAKAFIKKAERVFTPDDYKSVFSLYEVHGMKYKGETLDVEFEALKQALTPATDAKESPDGKSE